MKKHLIQLSLVAMLIGIAPLANAANTPVVAVPTHLPTTANTLPQTKEALVLMNRIETIQAMDVSAMSNSEKRALRKEVKSIEKQMKALGGVYISVGAIIIILLLIILFL